MSATTTATANRIIEIAPRINALYEPKGNLTFGYFNRQMDFILASSGWNASPDMIDEQIKAFYSKNEFEIQADFSEELYATSEAEYDEVMSLMAEKSPDESEWDGYGEWSAELEESDAWAGAVEVETEHGAVMIKPQCERIGLHKDCSIYKCERAMRLDGIDV